MKGVESKHDSSFRKLKKKRRLLRLQTSLFSRTQLGLTFLYVFELIMSVDERLDIGPVETRTRCLLISRLITFSMQILNFRYCT